jgi:hypothetical protein
MSLALSPQDVHLPLSFCPQAKHLATRERIPILHLSAQGRSEVRRYGQRVKRTIVDLSV